VGQLLEIWEVPDAPTEEAELLKAVGLEVLAWEVHEDRVVAAQVESESDREDEADAKKPGEQG
jgi:hypothetical protein